MVTGVSVRVYNILMVWNVLRKDIDMRYEQHIRVMYRIDSIKKEINNWQSILANLIEEELETNYATHKDTAIVYDKRVIGDNLSRLNDEMDTLENDLLGKLATSPEEQRIYDVRRTD